MILSPGKHPWVDLLFLSFLALHLQLLSCLTEATVISAVLRHANQLVPYFLCLPKQCRHLIKVRNALISRNIMNRS